MRIIAGEMRSRRLKAPEGMDTRPTLDRVREALFSILQGRVPSAKVLDLYAGSGALALEALSRGAESAVLVDCAPRACQAVQENIRALGCQERARLLRMKDLEALERLAREGAAFDLIFLDPPYRMDPAPVCAVIAEKRLLGKDGVIVVEHSHDREPQIGAPLTLVDRRRYGAAGLSLYRWMEGEEEHEKDALPVPRQL